MKKKEKQFGRFFKVVFAVVFTSILLIQEFQYCGTIVKAQFKIYENQVGEYYNTDLVQQTPVVHQLENQPKKESMGHVTFSPETLEENTEEVEVIERLDEYTNVVETEEEDVKQLEISLVPVNYEDNGEFKPIDTTIKKREVVIQEVIPEVIEQEEPPIEQTEEQSEEIIEEEVEEEEPQQEVEENLAQVYGIEVMTVTLEEEQAIETFEEKYPYYNDSNSYTMDFPIKLYENGVLIQKNDTKIYTQPIVQEVLAPEVQGNEIIYPTGVEQSIRYHLEVDI